MAPHLEVTAHANIVEENKRPNPEEKVVPKGYKGIFGEYVTELIWPHIIPIVGFHIAATYALLTFPYLSKPLTSLWIVMMSGVAGFGVTAGAHRYWCHRSYKATIPMQILLLFCYSAAGQNPIFDWVRDHRVHHRFSETDADPHNSNRGFFFSHVGWLFMRKHPDVLKKGRQIDMSDIKNDPLIKAHSKLFQILRVICCFLIPTAIPVYLWNEDIYYAFMSQCLIRYMIVLNSTWSVNSAAHLYGYKPYDTKINPRENFIVSIFAMGEGWHNYHHTFPWDYKASEFGFMNVTLLFLKFFTRIGWVYDVKEPSDELVKKVREKRGQNFNTSHDEVPEGSDPQKIK